MAAGYKTTSSPISPTEGGRFHRLAAALVLIQALALASGAWGLDLPSRRELRAKVLRKLEEIREMTPTAKARARWISLLTDANATLKEAILQGAPRYTPKEWEHAQWLCRLSLKYGRRREYRKGDYLARLCDQTAKDAQAKARKLREERRRRCREGLDRLYALLRRAVRRQSIARLDADDVRLQLRDLENALALEQFDEVERGISQLEPRLRSLASKKELWGL